MKLRTLLILALICLASVNVNAQFKSSNNIGHKLVNSHYYAANEGWNVQVQGGIDVFFAENAHGTVREAYSFAVGKNFTSMWGVRLQYFGGANKNGQVNRNGVETKEFTFQHANVYAEAVFNVAAAARGSRLGQERPLNVYLMAGPGYARSFKFSRGMQGTNSFSFMGGVSVSYDINEYFYVDLALTGALFTDKYNYFDGCFPLDMDMNTLLGVGVKF